MVTLCKSRQCFYDAYRSTPTSVYIVVVGFVARLLATVEGEGRWGSDVGVRHECWPSNTAEKIALISEIYFLPWTPLSLPFCLSLSCSCTMYPSFSLSILHSLLSHSRYPAEILALNLNWHSAIYHRFEGDTLDSLTTNRSPLLASSPPFALLRLRQGNSDSLRRNFPCTTKVLATRRHAAVVSSLSLFNGDDVPAQLGSTSGEEGRAEEGQCAGRHGGLGATHYWFNARLYANFYRVNQLTKI